MRTSQRVIEALRIARFELGRHVLSRRFLLATFGLPFFVALMVAASLWASSRRDEPEAPWGVVGDRPLAGVSSASVHSLAEARRSFDSGDIGGYVTLGEGGRATLWAPADSSLPDELRSALRVRAREAVLSEAPPDLRVALEDPIELRYATLAAPNSPPRSTTALISSLGLALGLPLVFVITVLFSTSLLVTAVAEERAGRLLELLTSSASPASLIAGKVLGLGGVGLIQTAVWLGAGGGVVLAVAGPNAREALLSLWALWVLAAAAFFVLGYLLFAAVMVAIGVWMGQPREAQQVAGIASLFLTMPFALMGLLLLRPASPAARALSLLPPTAPAAMPMRLALNAATPTEVLVSLLGLSLTVVASFLFAGRVFSSVVLGRRTGQRFRWLRRGRTEASASNPATGEGSGSAVASLPVSPATAPVERWAPSHPHGRRQAGNAVALVAWQEARTYLRRRSFLMTTFGLPVLGLLVTAVVAVAGVASARRAADELGGAFELDALRRQSEAPRLAVVPPPPLSGAFGGEDGGEPLPGEATWQVVESESAGFALLRGGEVDRLYVLPGDYPASREVVEWRPNLAPPERAPALESRLRAALWPDATAEQLAGLARPLTLVDRETLAPPPVADGRLDGEARAEGLDLEQDALPALVVLGMATLLYTAIFAASSYLLQSVTTEKENRVIELLLTSVPPVQLLGGKILGLGLLGLLQLVVWSGSGLLFAQGGLLAAAAVAALQVGPMLLLAGLCYFLLGYAFYAALMGAVGALVPSFQESGPLTFVVLFPAWTPFFFLEAILRAPEGALSRALSLAPPTAPLVMMLRVAVGAVSGWELALGIVLMALGSVAVVWAAARIFHSGNLLSGSGVGWRGLLRRRQGEGAG